MGWGGWESLMPSPIKFATTGDMGSWFGIPGLSEDQNSKIPGVGRFFKSDNQKDLEDQMKVAAAQYEQLQTQLPAARIAAGRGAANAFDSSSNFLGEMSGGKYQRPNFDQVFVNPNPATSAANMPPPPPPEWLNRKGYMPNDAERAQLAEYNNQYNPNFGKGR